MLTISLVSYCFFIPNFLAGVTQVFYWRGIPILVAETSPPATFKIVF